MQHIVSFLAILGILLFFVAISEIVREAPMLKSVRFTLDCVRWLNRLSRFGFNNGERLDSGWSVYKTYAPDFSNTILVLGYSVGLDGDRSQIVLEYYKNGRREDAAIIFVDDWWRGTPSFVMDGKGVATSRLGRWIAKRFVNTVGHMTVPLHGTLDGNQKPTIGSVAGTIVTIPGSLQSA